jgi:uncharacterized protein DUF2442
MIKISRAKYLTDYRIELEFSSGEVGQVDLSELVQRPATMVTPLRDPETFRGFFLELGALAWTNGFELSPESLYRRAQAGGTLRKARAA